MLSRWAISSLQGGPRCPTVSVVRLASQTSVSQGARGRGWHHEGASRRFVTSSFLSFFQQKGSCPDNKRAILRSQSGPGAGLTLSSVPSCAFVWIDSHLFQVFLVRRLRPLPQSLALCRCGRPLRLLGHDGVACSRAGVLGRVLL